MSYKQVVKNQVLNSHIIILRAYQFQKEYPTSIPAMCLPCEDAY